MKNVLGTLLSFCIALQISAQSKSLKGIVLDASTQLPIESAIIQHHQQRIITNADGSFLLKVASLDSLEITALGYKKQRVAVRSNDLVTILLEPINYYLDALEVKSIRASNKSPFTQTTISKSAIEQRNLGQDIPFILNQTPSIVVSSDAGNGIGYTGLRIRGTDATRINMTINGIPYNDAESQGLFLVNLPDIASSTNSIQIQRGVGTSSNGTGAFGATLNLSTNEFNAQPYAEINNSFGSFNTWKHTVKTGSGLIQDHFTIDARLSRISSDGYIDRASSNLSSFYLSTAYINQKTSVRFNVFSGKEKTYQAWYGIDENSLKTNRRFNSAGTEKPGSPYDNETDNYQQDHYQLFFNQQINRNWHFNTAIFYTKGRGYYEQYKANRRFSSFGLPNPIIGGTTITRTDVVRQLWLDNDFYGQIYALQYKDLKNEITIGGGWNSYDGDHFGKIIWAQYAIPKDYKWYDLFAKKTDIHQYIKWQHQLTNSWSSFVDVQYKTVKHRMDGFRNNPSLFINRSFQFVNPKMGIAYNQFNQKFYISYAVANKEPNRDDFEAGATQQPVHETLHDIELGYEVKNASFQYSLTGYWMIYKNQLILTGKVNDVGAYTRTNVPNSYRAGIELQGQVQISPKWSSFANATLSTNKIQSFTEYIDDYDNGGQKTIQHKNTQIAFSPSLIATHGLQFNPNALLQINLNTKHVGKQFLDNTSNNSRSLKAFTTQDLSLLYQPRIKHIKQIQLIAQVNNIWNLMYEPNGYTFSYFASGNTTTENYYYPMAGIHYMIGCNISF